MPAFNAIKDTPFKDDPKYQAKFDPSQQSRAEKFIAYLKADSNNYLITSETIGRSGTSITFRFKSTGWQRVLED